MPRTPPRIFSGGQGAAAQTDSPITTNIISAITADPPTGVAASSGGSGIVTLTATTAGTSGNSIGVSTTITSGLTGSAFNGDLAGGVNGQASIVAFDNIYTSCTAPVPAVNWSYDTGGTISTSVALSGDGTQVAFIHTPTSGAASVVILHWHAGDGTLTAPMPLTSQASGSNYLGCRSSTTTACMFVIAFGNGYNDSRSSPFYDFTNDVLYVGDDSGYLHKFTGVFNGAPAESSTNGWPVSLSSGNKLLSPVYDVNSKLVFVTANDAANTSGSGCYFSTAVNSGCLYSVTTTGSSSQTVLQSGEIARHTAISDGPIVESVSGKVYVFTANDSDSQSTSYCGTEDGNDACAAVWQFGTGFTAGTTGSESTMGIAALSGQAPTMYVGSFDNTFYNGNGTAGYLYVCGYAITGTVPTQSVASLNLYQIPVSTWPHSATNIGAITNASAGCSPVNEIYNARTFTGNLPSGTTITVSGASFTATDVGAAISDSKGGIPANTFITGYSNATTVTISNSATTKSSDTITVGDDWIYLSVTAAGTGTSFPCTGACLYGFNVARGTFGVPPLMGLQVAGGTSGIIIDNTAANGGSQIYFSYLSAATGTITCPSPSGATTGGCAVQASQSALK